MTDCRLPTAHCPLPTAPPLLVLTTATIPSMEQQMILQRLHAGDRLVGPVTVWERRGEGRQRRVRPWGFASGVRALRSSVEALVRRGLVTVTDAPGGGRTATLDRVALMREIAR